jgi:HTH-type transcriptional regulator/antitoxin HigA
MPVRELVAAGAIPASPADQASRARQLLAFFGVASPQAWQKLWARPTAASLRALLPELRSLTQRPLHEGVAIARAKLANVGVILVLIPEIRGVRAYGATRWLTPTTALIQLSLRGKTDDALWTTLFHELGHVLLHNKRELFVEFDEEPADTKHSSYGPAGTEASEAVAQAAPRSRRSEDRLSSAEAEARQFALRTLLGADIDRRLTTVKSHSDAYDVAESRGVAVSLVAARLAGVGLWTHREASALRKSVPSLEDLLGPPPAAPKPRARRAGHRRAGDRMPIEE